MSHFVKGSYLKKKKMENFTFILETKNIKIN